MKKRNILIILILLAVIAVSYIVFKIKSTEVAETISPGRPDIPNYITGQLPIEIAVEKSEFKFPSVLPTISLTKRVLTTNEIARFGDKLMPDAGFNEYKDINEGTKYFASNSKNFLVITPKTATVKFGMTGGQVPVVVDKNISDDEFTSIAAKFLTENGFYGEGQVRVLPPVYLKPSSASEGMEETTRDSANLFQIDFIPASSEYEILTGAFTSSPIFVQILPDGTIYNSEILLVETITKGISEYQIKNYDELTASLGEAKLIEIRGDYISPSDLTLKDVISLRVEKIRLAYFLESGKADVIQPIFVLEGPAQISDSTADYAIIYVPAFK